MNGVPLTGIVSTVKKNITHHLPCAISQNRASLEHRDNETTFSPQLILEIDHCDREILYCFLSWFATCVMFILPLNVF